MGESMTKYKKPRNLKRGARRPKRNRAQEAKVAAETEASELLHKLAGMMNWRTATGRKVLIANMTDSHIASAMHYMQRCAFIFATGDMGLDAPDRKHAPLIREAAKHLYGMVYEVMEAERARRYRLMRSGKPHRVSDFVKPTEEAPNTCVPAAWRAFMRGRPENDDSVFNESYRQFS
jgi:hypothetical protein